MNDQVSVKQQSAVQFVVRAPFQGQRTWAVYTLSEHGGTLTIQSDHGNFAHWWPERGDDFWQLMVSVGEDYFLKKLVGERTRFLYEETIENWRDRILKERRCCGITKEVAREAWNALNETEEFSGDRNDLLDWMLEDGPHTEAFENALGWDLMVEGTFMDFTLGQKNLYHMFRDHVVPLLKQELDKRKEAVPA